MAQIKGRQGMTKQKKREARLAEMGFNRKRDKASWRSSYHSQFKNAPGPAPMESTVCGIIKPKVEETKEV